MVVADTLTASVSAKLSAGLGRSQTYGGMSGRDDIEVSKINAFTDGSGASQASGWLSSSISVLTTGVTLSLANVDPLGAAGDDVPTCTVEGLKLRAVMICNDDTTNYITVAPGAAAGLTSWISGTTPTVRIPAGGMLLSTFPAGLDTLNDTVDDELLLTASVGTCICRVTFLFG